MIDACKIRLPTAETTASAGASLARTVYALPVTILLRGELGAGKTTFLQGFARALGVGERATSPTFALEQRYRARAQLPGGEAATELLHLDLYRLTPAQAASLVSASADHPGIRAVEWPQRAAPWESAAPTIAIDIRDPADAERTATVSFNDIALPTREEILQWREQVRLPEHIRRHCDAVAAVCRRLAAHLQSHGAIVRSLALERAAEAHDLLRFLDFRPGGEPHGHVDTADDVRLWEEWRERLPGHHHEDACAAFLRERGYGAIADIVAVHGLPLPSPRRPTIEQRLLFYADKRVRVDQVTSLRERFEDFRMRYGNGNSTPDAQAWHDEVARVESQLFPDGPPL